MRGRKVDPDFVSQFISLCIEEGKISDSDILQSAKDQISEIDEKLKEIEKLKIKRTKLLDIISSFDKPTKIDNNILHFFNLQKPNSCKMICDYLKNKPISIKSINLDKEELYFCIKQLSKYKIISISEDLLLRGRFFDEYMKIWDIKNAVQ